MRRSSEHLERKAVELCNIHPDHHVLEVGFGAGDGLQFACDKVKGGTGKVYGLDLSSYCTSRASHVLRHLIRAQKLDITPGSVQDLPYSSASMDCAFHVNAFFFWPDIGLACSELRRVLRPGGRLVCTQDLAFYRMLKQRQLLPMICVDPLHYMHMLEAVGFTDVRTEYFSHKGREYPAIMAVASSDLPPDRPLVDR